MDYYNMSIKQLISEIKSKDAEIANMKGKLKCHEEQKRNIEILGRQNKRLKKDNERYREILERNPNCRCSPNLGFRSQQVCEQRQSARQCEYMEVK